MKKSKLKFLSKEKALVLRVPKTPNGNKYAITNYGRVISFKKEIENGAFLKHGFISRYPSISIRSGIKPTTFLIHRLVAKYFLKRPSLKHKLVIHLNFKKEDNHYKNLKWVTTVESIDHSIKNRIENQIGNYKLTTKSVIKIKKMLLSGKMQLKVIAKKFGVTDMQIHRIKTGENWGYLKI